MMQKENFKRLLATALALSMAWSGFTPGSGLSLVQATEAGETKQEESSEEKSQEESKASKEETSQPSEDAKEVPASDSSAEDVADESTDDNESQKDVDEEAKEDENAELDEKELLEEEKLLKEKEEEEDKEEDEDKLKLIADFDFENLEDNAAITGGGAKATGTYSVVDSFGESGKAISLSDGKKQFLNVTKENGDSLLAGLKSVSISFDANIGRTGTDWLFYSAPNENPQSSPEYYLGAANISSKLTIEQFKNGRENGTTNTPIAINTWTHIDVVYSQDETIVYVDGEKKSSFSSDNKLEDILGANPITYIGKANWGSGEYCRAYLDNYRIYQGKLTDSDVADLYKAFLDKKVGKATEVEFSLNLGYVTGDINLPAEYDGKKISWKSSDEKAVTNDGKVTRGNKNKEVTLTATIDGADKEFKIVVLKEGEDIATYVSNSPAVGQDGGMKIAAKKNGSFEALHKNQPIMYTSLGSKAYQSPTVLRQADGEGFYMVAADGPSGNLIVYESDDLISYKNEKSVSTGSSVSNVKQIEAKYDMTDERYEIYLKTNDGAYLVTSKDMESFDKAVLIEGYSFEEKSLAPKDAVSTSILGLTKSEYEKLTEKFTNPYNTSLSSLPTDEIKVEALTS
ncbi:LamG-like jellyroll fold domain-containing protein, partial [Pseudobutyrivibrio sp.]